MKTGPGRRPRRERSGKGVRGALQANPKLGITGEAMEDTFKFVA